MKLNNQQVSALADKIYNQITKSVDTENEILRASFSFDKWKKNNKDIVAALENSIKWCKEYVKLAKIESRYNDFFQASEVNNTDTLKGLFEDTIEDKKYPCTRREIEQDIILETIECENLDSIITKLIDKYTK